MRNTVLLLRSGDESSEDIPDRETSCAWEKALCDAGFDTHTLPVLRFEYAKQDELYKFLQHPDRYAGLIFTSPRAVEAFSRAFPGTGDTGWKNKALFAVGPRTAAAMRSLGYEPEGERTGSAEQLAAYILQRHAGGTLLFLCGDRRRDALPSLLHEAGFCTEEIVVYRTRLRTLPIWPGDKKPDWVVFFSPSGLEAILKSPEISLEGISIAAIGSVTAEAVRTHGFRVRATAQEPTPEALALALQGA